MSKEQFTTIEQIQVVSLATSRKQPDIFQVEIEQLAARFTSKAKAERVRREIQKVLTRTPSDA